MSRGDASKRLVALTFDAGSGAEGTEAILSVLRQNEVHATFFLTGNWVSKFPEIARKIADSGHELGNHSVSHPRFPDISDAQMIAEVTGAEERIKKATGADTKPLFRAPYGAYDARVLKVLRALGYINIYWSLDSTDWREESTAASISERVLEKAENGFIIVHHASPTKTAEALKVIIPGLKSKGFSIVTVSKLL